MMRTGLEFFIKVVVNHQPESTREEHLQAAQTWFEVDNKTTNQPLRGCSENGLLVFEE